MKSCNNCAVMETLKELMASNENMRKVYREAGRASMKVELMQAAENGTPIELNDGRAWFLKSDIQNLRDIFEDLEAEAKKEPVMCSFGVLKQLIFDCVANLMLIDKPRKEVADDLLKALAELDKYKIAEDSDE